MEMEILIENGFSGIGSIMDVHMNTAVQIEGPRHHSADLYERNSERKGYANVCKPKMLKNSFWESTYYL